MKSARKIRLDLGALHVESFATDADGGAPRGTVRALSGDNPVDSRVAGCTEPIRACSGPTFPTCEFNCTANCAPTHACATTTTIPIETRTCPV